ncbi:Arylsulfatase precursor [Planctomycetes bacterium MalM25]|nr:Arylsulfatase precursor [Planctomycetes bacterium MalM25]
MPHRLALLLLPLLLAACSIVTAGERPNVLFIITDDQGYGDLSCHGNPVLKTPHLDALHAQSARFTDFHVSPTCSPSRGALMSGHYTNRCGPWHTIMGRSILFEGETTLGEAFAAAGYTTGMFGKWHLGDNYPFRPEDRGFDRVVRHGGGGVGQTPDVWDNAYFDDSYFCDGRIERREGFCTDVFFAEAKRFIQRSVDAGEPFFAYVSTNAPHGPLHCPEEYAAPYRDQVGEKQALFFGMIANIDKNVGALRDWLQSEGLADNTLVVFMTDNGSATGAGVHNVGMRGHKGSEYEGGHRVPLFVHWPAGGYDRGVDIDRLSAHLDVLPTLQELCELPAKDDYPLDGRSLVPLLNDPQAEWADRVIVTDSQRVIDPIKWKNCSTMSQRWRLVNGKQLYEIAADPGQKNDLAARHPEVVERLRAAYDAWWESLQPALSKHAEFVLGNPAENPSRLTCHDWLTDGKPSPWNQATVRAGQQTLGDWAVRVEHAGRYRITLRRWPAEADKPLTAGLPAGAAVPGLKAFRETPGKALAIRSAGVRIAGYEAEQPVEPDAGAVAFEADLPAGSTRLMGYFELAGGGRVGSYYAEVERLSERVSEE